MEAVLVLLKEIKVPFKLSHREIRWEDEDPKPLETGLKEMRFQLFSKRI
jgi:hypothetical protein